jgi:hypothetical protein
MSRSKQIKKILRPIAKKVYPVGLGHWVIKGQETRTKDGRIIPNIRTVGKATEAVVVLS